MNISFMASERPFESFGSSLFRVDAGYGSEIATLTAQIAKLQRMLYGQSSEINCEKIAQAEKRINTLQEKLGTAQSQLTTMAGHEAASFTGRKTLPATLPVTGRSSSRRKQNARHVAVS